MADRGALLQQIQAGKRLKKAQTSDRSAAPVGKPAGGGGGGGGPPMGGMALPRPPVPPPGGFSSSTSSASSVPAEPRTGPPPGMPGLGGLFSGGMPKLKHRGGGVSIAKTSENGGTAAPNAPLSHASSQEPAGQKASGGSRFQLPFRRNSHARSNSQTDEPAPQAVPMARAPLPPPASSGLPALPGRRPSDVGSAPTMPAIPAARLPPIPPSSAPASRPSSSVAGKKAPPPPPSSRKPQIKPKPMGLGTNRMAPQQQSPGLGSMSDLRGSLRAVGTGSQGSPATSPSSARNSVDDVSQAGGIVEESQGSVSSLAGMFGQSVRGKAHGHNRTLTGNTFAPPAPVPQMPAKAPPHLPSAANNAFGHRRANSSSAPSHPPPPPPSQAVGKTVAPEVPLREGRWTFHSISELPPPPPAARIPRHVYPSGNNSGSAIALDI